MRSTMKIFAVVFTIAASAAVASDLYAHEAGGSRAYGSTNIPAGTMGVRYKTNGPSGEDRAGQAGAREVSPEMIEAGVAAYRQQRPREVSDFNEKGVVTAIFISMDEVRRSRR